MDKAIDVRRKISHFRILIIGRANAGKTTILKKVCNSVEDPEIYDPDGNKIDPEIVNESAERGLHDIDNQLIFMSNPQFIFHDSRGFEGGSADEIQKVIAFIRERGETTELSEQLHAIWYCLPTDGNRPLLEAEDRFFEISVPLIVIFTKFDGLVTKAFQQLRGEGKNIRMANAGKIELAQRMLTTNYRDQLNGVAFKPSAYVQLDDMRLEWSSCTELINQTANTLTDDALLLLFVSVQRNNIDLCIWWAVREALDDKELTSVIKWTLAYFPHVWDKNVAFCIDALKNKLPAVEYLIETPLGLAQLVALLCICAEHTFTEGSVFEEGFGTAFVIALDAYVGSPTEAAVTTEISEMDPEADFETRRDKLCDIIKAHRLRADSNMFPKKVLLLTANFRYTNRHGMIIDATTEIFI
ncbi:GTP-binding protein [Mycena sanguinolenta]|uniref:GTP-binding protein n=1 Tax=Mycena sanguinolenta TaxID=230812 RepID=A0A8H6XN72_9AGAR|nr:GTP-binding protein [Mycena sanguinolenta]